MSLLGERDPNPIAALGYFAAHPESKSEGATDDPLRRT